MCSSDLNMETKFFPESALPAIEKMCESHEGIIALETMMASMKDGSFAGDTASASELNEADLRKMMDDPKYWKDHLTKTTTVFGITN